MPSRYRYKIPDTARTTGADIVAQLKILQDELAKSELSGSTPFNSTYIVITQAIDTAVKRKAFENPATVLRLEQTFADIYFDALNEYSTTGALPGRWRPVRWRHLPASVSLMFGARAHITQDLAPALRKSVPNAKEFAKDFEHINRVLIARNPEILKSYNEPIAFLDFFKRHLSFIYQPLVMQVVMYWRKRAWKEFIKD